MDFVVMILETIFHKSHEDAISIMLKVHRQGLGLCGYYPYEVAESKTRKVTTISRENQYPLKCTMEPE
jgi:ATP-dependent Clp protease adaptor protein ClpS